MSTKQELAINDMFEKFEQNVQLDLQQKPSKLRPTVTEVTSEGNESAFVEVFKASEGCKIVGDLSDTKYNNTKQERRWITHAQYGWAERIDPFATLDSGINPMLPYAKLATYAMHRLQDESILEGMLGINIKGQNRNGTEFFPKENIITAVDGDDFFRTFIGQLITAKAIFKKRHIDLDGETVYVLVPSDVWASLFALDKATSKDYVNRAALQTGELEYFAGVYFVNMEKVPGEALFPVGTNFPGLIDSKIDPNSPTGEIKVLEPARFENPKIKYVLPIYCRSAVAFTQRKELTVKYSKDPLKWPVMLYAYFGATRVDPDKILGIEISHESLKGVPQLASYVEKKEEKTGKQGKAA